MFQILNLSKRLDAAEVGMQKLASLMEDLVKRGSTSFRYSELFNNHCYSFKCGRRDYWAFVSGPLPITPKEAEQFSEQAKELRSSLDDSNQVSIGQTIEIEKRLEKLEKAVFEGGSTAKRSGKTPKKVDHKPEPEPEKVHVEPEKKSSPIQKPNLNDNEKSSPKERTGKQSPKSSSSTKSFNKDEDERERYVKSKIYLLYHNPISK